MKKIPDNAIRFFEEVYPSVKSPFRYLAVLKTKYYKSTRNELQQLLGTSS